MSLLNWTFDAYQHHCISQLHEDNARLRQETAMRATGGVWTPLGSSALQGELALAVKTVKRLAIERGLCTEDELLETLRGVDLEDGRADGRAPLT